LAYRDSAGTLKRAEPLYEERVNRGFLHVYVTNECTRMVNGIYAGIEIPILGIRQVQTTGQMTVK
jgi:hypothetical protein